MARRSDHTREELRELAIAAATAAAEREGLRAITARGIARDIGYTVGTLYNLFENLDDLLRQMNAATMDALYARATAQPLDGDPETALRELARRYLAFVREHSRLWSAVIEFEPHDRAPPDWYRDKAQRLIGLGEAAIAGLFGPGEAAARRRSANVLWSALYGITALAQAAGSGNREAPEVLIDALITTYLAGLEARQGRKRD